MVKSIVDAIVEAITGLLGGVGTSIVGVFEDLFIVSTTGEGGAVTKSISTLGIWGLAFLGVGFASTLMWTILRKI